MSFSLGIYDLVANILPGCFYIFVAYLGIVRWTNWQIDFAKTSLWYIVLLGVTAFVAGLVIDPIANNLWYKLFKGRKSQAEIVAELNEANEVIKFRDEKFSWTLLSHYVKLQDSQLTDGIRRASALNIMLRNASFALFLIFVLVFCDIFVSGFLFWQVVIGVLSLLFSFLAFKQAQRFDEQHFQGIYLAIAATQMKTKDLPVKRKEKKEEK